jgi:methyl-accepting chemotaxis protein
MDAIMRLRQIARTQSLRAKMTAAFMAVGLVIAVVIGVNVVSMTTRMADDTGQGYQRMAAAIADTIDRNLFERYGDVQAFGANRAVLDRASWYQAGAEHNQVVKAANRYAQLYGLYQLLMMVDTEGRVIAVNDRDASGKPIDTAWLYSKNFAAATWFKDAMAGRTLDSATLKGTVVEDAHFDEDVKRVNGGDGLVLGFSALVRDDGGNPIGVWNNRATFGLVEDVVTSAYIEMKRQRLGSTELTVLDREGRVLVDYDPVTSGAEDVRRDPAVLLRLNLVEKGVAAAQRLVAGESGHGRSLHARKTIWQTSGYAASKGAMGYAGLGWGVMVRTDERESLATIRRLRFNMFLVLGAIVLGLGAIAWLLSRALTRPIMGSVAGLGSGADQVALAAGQLSESAQSLSRGATEQAASLEETSASMEEMASMTASSATSASHAAERAQEVDVLLRTFGEALQGTAASMDRIRTSSAQVSKIIKTVDEIAFQTNILALNAAVEAARAGAAGMGFAVVADEVRNLAQRSAQAARDTTSLIEEAIVSSEEGVRSVEQITASIGGIQEKVSEVGSLVQSMREASRQQAAGVRQVSQAVVQLEKITQSAAATAEESAAASEELSAQVETTRFEVQILTEVVNGRRNRSGGEANPAAGPLGAALIVPITRGLKKTA